MTTAIVVAGTGKVSVKAALALLKDHVATLPDEDDFDLVLPLPRDTSHVNYALLDYVDEFPNVTLFAPVGTVIDEEVLEHVDSATFIENPTGNAFDLLEEGDIVLLAFDDEDEDKEKASIAALKLAQSKGATVLDLTDGLLELRWEDEPEDEPTPVEEPVEEEEQIVEEAIEALQTAETPEEAKEVIEEVKAKRTRRTKAQIAADAAAAEEPAPVVEKTVETQHDDDASAYFHSGWKAGYKQAREDIMMLLVAGAHQA